MNKKPKLPQKNNNESLPVPLTTLLYELGRFVFKTYPQFEGFAILKI
jgi:hypothetical protein